MAKGARNRARRQAAAGDSSARLSRHELAGLVFDVDSVEQFKALIAADPRVLEDATIRELDGPQHAAGYAEHFARKQELLREARVDPDAAWERHQAWFAEAERAGDQLKRLVRVAEDAYDVGQFRETLTTLDQALPLAQRYGFGAVAYTIHTLRGRALLHCDGDRGANVDAAIDAFEHGLQHSLAGDDAAYVLDLLGSAFAQRPRGDHGENIENAIAAQRQGLDELTPNTTPEILALTRTNLAATLLSRERGDRLATLREAISLCRAALSYRSPSRDGTDWAYTQLNFAGALERVAALAGDGSDLAKAAFEEVIANRDQIADRSLVGAAYASIGRILLDRALPTAEQQLEALERERGDEELSDDRELLDEARQYLELAQPLVADAGDPMVLGRLLRDLASVYDNLGRQQDAFITTERAVAVLKVVGAPRDLVGVAFRLGGMHADRGDWSSSAEAFAQAVRAAETGLAARLDDATREDEQRRFPTVHRWAAYALGRVGRVEEAALTLESGRARALRLRLGIDAVDPESLDRLPGELRADYVAASAQVALAPLGPAGAPQRRELAKVLTAVRELPGLSDFATGLNIEWLVNAAAPGAPLLYVNPTPWGTMLLSVSADAHPAVDLRLLDRPTALELYSQLVASVDLDNANHNDDELGGESYLLAVTGHGDEPDYLKRAIDHAFGFVGKALARPIAKQLEKLEAHSVTLVLCGPVGAVPVGACAWTARAGEEKLIDRFTVAYAPSAMVAAIARARAAARRPNRRLVALGDPNGNLEAAGPEVREIARGFDPNGVLATGDAATLSFLRSHAAAATHIHLACHASGGLFDRDDSLLALADGAVTIEQLTAIEGLWPRLVVVSACQAAQSELSGLPEEALSIGAALLAAGAAGAIAALWPVHDAATALLMVRLYEHLNDGIEPPEALRRAQTWLRDLTELDRRAFEAAHPLLRGELRRLAPDPDDPARVKPLQAMPGSATPFAHPDFWAGFVAMGA